MQSSEPSFKALFGAAWEELPAVFRKRYSNRSFSNDLYTVTGKMDIHFSKLMACFMPIFRLMHVLVPYQGEHIPVTVNFRSQPNSNAIYLDRLFYFPNKKPYAFNSYMQVVSANEVIEHMKFGLGWKTLYFYDGKKIVMQHKNYLLTLFGFNIPLPLELFVGKGYAEETVIDENTYRVTMSMTHFLFGLMYSYTGDFSFSKPSL